MNGESHQKLARINSTVSLPGNQDLAYSHGVNSRSSRLARVACYALQAGNRGQEFGVWMKGDSNVEMTEMRM